MLHCVLSHANSKASCTPIDFYKPIHRLILQISDNILFKGAASNFNIASRTFQEDSMLIKIKNASQK